MPSSKPVLLRFSYLSVNEDTGRAEAVSLNADYMREQYGAVTAHIAQYPTYGTEFEADQEYRAISEKLKRGREDQLLETYCNLKANTVSFTFEWAEQSPDEFRALETWWGKVQAGDDPSACYRFYLDNVMSSVTIAWQAAVQQAQNLLTPPTTRPESLLTEEQRSDPN